jgi:hypothetical protein
VTFSGKELRLALPATYSSDKGYKSLVQDFGMETSWLIYSITEIYNVDVNHKRVDHGDWMWKEFVQSVVITLPSL